MNAVIYARVSTQEQADSGLSIQSQIARCKQFCSEKGFGVKGFLSQSAISAREPFLQRIHGWVIETTELADCEKIDDEDVIVALSFDRLFRSVADFLVTMEVFEDRGSSIFLVDGGELLVDEPEQWLAQMMKAVFAEYERKLVSRRTSRALQQAKANGKKIGEAPYGWQNVGDGRHAPNLAEQVVVKAIIDLSSDGWSARRIADHLNATDVRTREGKIWGHSQIARILGRLEPNSEIE